LLRKLEALLGPNQPYKPTINPHQPKTLVGFKFGAGTLQKVALHFFPMPWTKKPGIGKNKQKKADKIPTTECPLFSESGRKHCPPDSLPAAFCSVAFRRRRLTTFRLLP
jgi:hypothetical protein